MIATVLLIVVFVFAAALAAIAAGQLAWRRAVKVTTERLALEGAGPDSLYDIERPGSDPETEALRDATVRQAKRISELEKELGFVRRTAREEADREKERAEQALEQVSREREALALELAEARGEAARLERRLENTASDRKRLAELRAVAAKLEADAAALKAALGLMAKADPDRPPEENRALALEPSPAGGRVADRDAEAVRSSLIELSERVRESYRGGSGETTSMTLSDRIRALQEGMRKAN